jgi:hypothetical protein
MPIAKIKEIELYYEEHGKGVPLVLISGMTAVVLSQLALEMMSLTFLIVKRVND